MRAQFFAISLSCAGLLVGCVGAHECTTNADCASGACIDGACEGTTTAETTQSTGADATDATGIDSTDATATSDATDPTDAADATTAIDLTTSGDMSTAPDTSTSTDADVGEDLVMWNFDPPGTPTAIAPGIPLLFRGAAALGQGIVAVGPTENDFEPGESREAVAVHYLADGSVAWATRFGDPQNDQFFAAATRSGATVLGGMTRGYAGGTVSNGDMLLVRADATGLGAAFSYGTDADELLFDLAPGGDVAAWLGTGTWEDGGDRDVLVAAFDTDLSPLWTWQIDLGADDAGIAVAALGSRAIVVGHTLTAGDASTRRNFVASVGADGVDWAKRTANPGADVFSVDTDGSMAWIGGSWSPVGGGRVPAWFRVDGSGAIDGATVEVGNGNGVTGVVEQMGRRGFVGQRGDLTPFIVAESGSGYDLLTIDGLRTPGFLAMPIIRTGGTDRMVVGGPDYSVVDVPFTLAPAAGCEGNEGSVGSTPITGDAFEELAVGANALAVEGREITSPRQSALTTATAPGVCVP